MLPYALRIIFLGQENACEAAWVVRVKDLVTELTISRRAWDSEAGNKITWEELP